MSAGGLGKGRWAPLALLMVAGCFTTANPPVTSSASSGSGSGSPSGSASTGGESTGTASGGNGASSTGGSSASSGGGIGTTGGSLSPLIDGGYVFCNIARAADAGPNGDGGPASWMCQPGTYLCDMSGNLGTCYQCLSDADCTNRALPTYDPRRPHCDLGSGLAGRQNFCQECTSNSDCDGNPGGPFCSLNANYPPDSLQPSIVTVGFETCGKLQTDCRLDAGPRCDMFNEVCDPTRGSCVYVDPFFCLSDQDCIGILSPSLPDSQVQPNLLAPFCVDNQCNACDGNFCPGSPCGSDSSCGNPTSSDGGLLCGVSLQTDDYDCLCTSSAQCGSFWPACVGIGNGTVNPLGEPAGICGCDRDDECGDGGLVCLTPSATGYNAETGRSFCGLPCTSPRFPACASATAGTAPICLPTTRLCEPCAASDQCRGEVDTGGDVCLGGSEQGMCGCAVDTDCPVGQSCTPYGSTGTCVVLLPQCVHDSCFTEACNWDSGTCQQHLGCARDSDCDWPAPFCDHDGGFCIECRVDADCVTTGLAAELDAPRCVQSECSSICNVDQDCAGNPAGQHCNAGPDGGFLQGTCDCLTNLDCDAGLSCQVGQCSAFCLGDNQCPSGYFCAPSFQCRPRCDGNNICQGFEPICDTNDIHGENGTGANGVAAPGATWCYDCLSSSDCPNGLACLSGFQCGNCGGNSDCAPDGVCNYGDGTCHQRCDAGFCPSGEVCDTLGTAGYGTDVCLACVTALDCPDQLGCNPYTHSCGSCQGPGVFNGSAPAFYAFDCPPDAVCSDFWSTGRAGVCLNNCDLRSCPPSEPICAVLPRLTTDHKYCFGCLQDSDCADAGTGAWCDVSVNYTFQCQPGSG